MHETIKAWQQTYVYAAPEVQYQMVSAFINSAEGVRSLIAENVAWAAEIERLTALLDANSKLSVGVQLYSAEVHDEQAAEIARLRADLAISDAEIERLRENSELRDLRGEGYAGIEASDIESWRYVGGACPLCGQSSSKLQA